MATMDFMTDDAGIDKSVACLRLALSAGAPANDCRLGDGAASGRRFSAVLLKRCADDLYLVGLIEPASGYVYCVIHDAVESEVIALWRGLGRRLGLALAIETPEGAVELIEPAPRPARRRRGSNVARRRCRFSAGREIGAAPARAAGQI
jgi:hypothetical protein